MAESVAKQVLAKLVARLESIIPSNDCINDIGGRVYKRRPVYDVDHKQLPALFIFRRAGGDQREVSPGQDTKTVTVVYDVVGFVASTDKSGDAAEDLLADIERRVEQVGDLYLVTETTKNLLSQELVLVGAEVEAPPAGSKVEAVAIGIQAVFPHRYGDPDLVV